MDLVEACGRLVDGVCVSKIFGYFSILGACVYKLPVVIKILKARNGSGLNPVSIYMETTAYCVLVLYNYQKGNALSTFGDYALSSLQNVAIISLVWWWGVGPKDPRQITARHIQTVLSVAVVLVSVLYRFRQVLEANVEVLPLFSYAVIAASRIPQIFRNNRTGVVGVQSMITLTNAVIGSCNKVVIAYYETKDPYILWGSVVTVALNSVLALQVLWLNLKAWRSEDGARTSKKRGTAEYIGKATRSAQ